MQVKWKTFWLGSLCGLLFSTIILLLLVRLYLSFGIITISIDKEYLISQTEIIIYRELHNNLEQSIKEIKENLPRQIAQETIEYLSTQKFDIIVREIRIAPGFLEILRPGLETISSKILEEQLTEEKINSHFSQIAKGISQEIENSLDYNSTEFLITVEIIPNVPTRLRFTWK